MVLNVLRILSCHGQVLVLVAYIKSFIDLRCSMFENISTHGQSLDLNAYHKVLLNFGAHLLRTYQPLENL